MDAWNLIVSDGKGENNRAMDIDNAELSTMADSGQDK